MQVAHVDVRHLALRAKQSTEVGKPGGLGARESGAGGNGHLEVVGAQRPGRACGFVKRQQEQCGFARGAEAVGTVWHVIVHTTAHHCKPPVSCRGAGPAGLDFQNLGLADHLSHVFVVGSREFPHHVGRAEVGRVRNIQRKYTRAATAGSRHQYGFPVRGRARVGYLGFPYRCGGVHIVLVIVDVGRVCQRRQIATQPTGYVGK